MLTIGELADLAGTTVRAIRHYHAEGVLPEPIRDSLGHRRYGLPDLVRLVRIRELREIGLPLDRVPAALGGELKPLLDRFDDELAEQERQIALQRKKIAELRESTPDLPDAIRGLYAHLVAHGVRTDLAEIDLQAWQLVAVRSPEALAEFAETCERTIADPRALQAWLDLALRFQHADPDDTELMNDLTAVIPESLRPDEGPPAALAKMLGALLTPAQRRAVGLP